jgi:thioredoxin 1
MTHHVSDASFEAEVLKAEGPVIVDFWAEWCGPGKAKIVKINIDESPNAPTKYGVRGIPTLMVFKNGQVTDTRVGSMSKSQLSEWAQSAI